MQNPLLKVKLGVFGSWLVSHLLGANWQTALWNSLTTALETWLSANAGASSADVTRFAIDHINEFIMTLSHANPFLGAMAEGVLDPLFTSFVSGAVAYVEAKVASVSPAPAVVQDQQTSAQATS